MYVLLLAQCTVAYVDEDVEQVDALQLVRMAVQVVEQRAVAEVLGDEQHGLLFGHDADDLHDVPVRELVHYLRLIEERRSRHGARLERLDGHADRAVHVPEVHFRRSSRRPAAGPASRSRAAPPYSRTLRAASSGADTRASAARRCSVQSTS